MEKDVSEPDPSCLQNGTGGVLYGEFMDSQNDSVRYSVSLSESALTIQSIFSSAGRTKVVFNLSDCVGCRANRAPDSEDVGAYFTAYFYPFKRRWMSAGEARQRLEQCFRVALVQDPIANLQEAERWARAIRDASALQAPRRPGVVYTEVRRPCRVMILVNPNSGRGQALQLFSGHVQGMLTEASVPYELVITEKKNHARELVMKADLTQWDALVIMSGDGLLFEVINGLMDREDWQQAIQTPLGILPGGSGNALAASVHHYSQAPPAWNEELLLSCGFMLCKGLVGPLDLVSIHLSSRQRLFSFLSIAWGFVADVDMESEKYRHVGAIRFLMGTLVRLATLRVYQGRLAYLPFDETSKNQKGNSTSPPPSLCSSLPCRLIPKSPNQNSLLRCSSTNTNRNTMSKTSVETQNDSNTKVLLLDSLLPSLYQPVPESWAVVKEEDFVLVLAMTQSHLAEDLWTAPAAVSDDGVIHLFYVTGGISRPALLRLFLAMEKGAHLDCGCPYLMYEKVRAFRLEPLTPQGVIAVDGEPVAYGPLQAQVHPGIARLVCG
ncbi:sphingosine kinase 1-like [Eucyclogobius newberryi]|uniref:sphingosine kinase 1-like n=1 Tax=Eucyclogobius newberryi TaxID=166745 RepID=UPI003B592D59